MARYKAYDSFVSELDREIVALFRDVLLYASELGLIGKEHFAVDGCKLPSNASKEWSGTHRELEERRKKLEQVAERIMERHQRRDQWEPGGAIPWASRQLTRRSLRSGPDSVRRNSQREVLFLSRSEVPHGT